MPKHRKSDCQLMRKQRKSKCMCGGSMDHTVGYFEPWNDPPPRKIDTRIDPFYGAGQQFYAPNARANWIRLNERFTQEASSLLGKGPVGYHDAYTQLVNKLIVNERYLNTMPH